MIDIDIQKDLGAKNDVFKLDVRLSFEPGAFISLFGPSGSGKTTILRMIAGLIPPDKGMIRIGNEVWFDRARNINVPVQRRSIGFVFQDYTVFPNMTVRQNIEFAFAGKKDNAFVEDLLRLVDLKTKENSDSRTLSGGEKQRLALARALARKPRILLMDEPFSALDIGLRQQLQDMVIDVYQRYKVTTVFVSHEVGDIFKLSRRVFLLDKGRITASGSPDQVLLNKDLSSKFRFIGSVLDIVRDDVIYIVTVQIGSSIIKTVACEDDIAQLKVGDKVVVSSKAFNPVIMKLNI